ncbi:LAETG motif-containing sortase-dependent surface protein [Streptomyces lushanensis]|uniref:LAETG motif-containing sortase-dependent surface protein n=1 Tax=Streptomyces lushanensis TaxID=1434255 RepID=UPI000B0DFF1B|nr:LAETG motif-containing sortase-dependent surface protein [Streptomyces lushanensis]
MTLFSGSWRRRGALITAATAGALAVGLSAAPAFAHTPTWSVTCSEVSLDLTAYGNSDKNTVTVTVDGKDLLPTENFQNEFHKKLTLPDHSAELTVRLVVKAADGERYNVDDQKTAPVCEGTSPSPSESESTTPPPAESPSSETPSEETPSEAAPATPTEEPTSSEDALPSSQPSPAGDNLAETGSSSATPMIAGAAAVVVVAGAGIMWAARKRRTVQN